MPRRFTLLAFSSLALAGCAAPPMPAPPSINHPANPQAAEAPIPTFSKTLAIDANPTQPVRPPPDESGGPEKKSGSSMQDMPGMSNDGSMGGMAGMSDMPGMNTAPAMGGTPKMKPNHSMPGMPEMNQDAPATMPAGPTSQPAAIYTCPMHPQITSDKPGHCPICGMTLVQKGGAQGGGQ